MLMNTDLFTDNDYGTTYIKLCLTGQFIVIFIRMTHQCDLYELNVFQYYELKKILVITKIDYTIYIIYIGKIQYFLMLYAVIIIYYHVRNIIMISVLLQYCHPCDNIEIINKSGEYNNFTMIELSHQIIIQSLCLIKTLYVLFSSRFNDIQNTLSKSYRLYVNIYISNYMIIFRLLCLYIYYKAHIIIFLELCLIKDIITLMIYVYIIDLLKHDMYDSCRKEVTYILIVYDIYYSRRYFKLIEDISNNICPDKCKLLYFYEYDTILIIVKTCTYFVLLLVYMLLNGTYHYIDLMIHLMHVSYDDTLLHDNCIIFIYYCNYLSLILINFVFVILTPIMFFLLCLLLTKYDNG